jgi:hypothetical protein
MIFILSIFVCAFLLFFSGYSQNTVSSSIASSTDEVTVTSEVKVRKALELLLIWSLLLWFMGSKQDPNTTISTEGINTKQIMTSLLPNRLLIKSF